MTIEELPESLRCPDCGTWLPRAALECPQCGRPRDLAMGTPPGRWAPSRRLMIGGGAAGAIVLGGAIFFLLSPHDDPPLRLSPSQLQSEIAFATVSPSPTPRPTRSPRSTATPAASSSIAPTSTPLPPPVARAPLRLPASIVDLGRRAIVQVPNLRVRNYVGLNAQIQVQLGLGSELFLRLGPISADGFDWYAVNYQPLFDEPPLNQGGGYGWVAAGPAGEQPTFIAIGPARCQQVPVTTALIASMTELAISECLGDDSYELHAVVQTCYEGPYGPYTYEPAYFGFSCYFIFELGTTAWLSIHIPPAVVLPEGFARGDVVRVVGHVYDPAAADCQVSTTEAIEPGSLAIEQQVFSLMCRSAFVLSELEVTGHVDIPDPFGP